MSWCNRPYWPFPLGMSVCVSYVHAVYSAAYSAAHKHATYPSHAYILYVSCIRAWCIFACQCASHVCAGYVCCLHTERAALCLFCNACLLNSLSCSPAHITNAVGTHAVWMCVCARAYIWCKRAHAFVYHLAMHPCISSACIRTCTYKHIHAYAQFVHIYMCPVCAYIHSSLNVRILLTHMQTCMHEETFVHVAQTYTCILVLLYARSCAFILIYFVHARVCVYVWMHVCVCMNAYVCVCVCAWMCISIQV